MLRRMTSLSGRALARGLAGLAEQRIAEYGRGRAAVHRPQQQRARRHWPGGEVALQFAATELDQDLVLAQRLDAFGHHLQP